MSLLVSNNCSKQALSVGPKQVVDQSNCLRNAASDTVCWPTEHTDSGPLNHDSALVQPSTGANSPRTVPLFRLLGPWTNSSCTGVLLVDLAKRTLPINPPVLSLRVLTSSFLYISQCVLCSSELTMLRTGA